MISTRCSDCGTTLLSDAGLCPVCILGEALATRSVGSIFQDETIDEVQSPESKISRFTGLGRLGRYDLIEIIGRGGMGEVYRAFDPNLNREVAIKTMREELARSLSARQRFLREARAIAAIEHENIIVIYEVDEDRGVPFLAMRLLEGQSLKDYLKERGAVDIPLALRFGRQIASGLAAAHDRGVIHRDVKPGNLFLVEDEDGSHVKILDFGLARTTETGAEITHPGEVFGTPSFMAPEQAQGQATDGRCDLFSLGCVLYRMCTGIVPFPGDDAMSVFLSLATTTPRPASHINPAVPPSLSILIARLLEKDPAKRPTDARSVATQLAAIEIPTTRDPANRETGAPSHRSTSRRWGYIAASLTLVLLGVLFGGDFIRFATKKPDQNVDSLVPAEIESKSKGAWIDLLPRIDLTRDILEGEFTRDRGDIVNAGGYMHRLRMPVRLKGAYELEAEFTQMPLAPNLHCWSLPAVPMSSGTPHRLGLQLKQTTSIGQVYFGFTNLNQSYGSDPGFLKTDQRQTLLIRVEPGEETNVVAWIDGKPFAQWHGKLEAKHDVTEHDFYKHGAIDEPHVNIRKGIVRYHAIRVRPLDGTVTAK